MDSEIVRLHKLWNSFGDDRSRARRDIQERLDKYNAVIQTLRDEGIRLQTEFEDQWKNRKKETQDDRDMAVMNELATGRSAKSILKELGSNNTVWIYDLRAKVQGSTGIPERGNVNTPRTEP